MTVLFPHPGWHRVLLSYQNWSQIKIENGGIDSIHYKFKNEAGQVMSASADDRNHPLAGKTLFFDIDIVSAEADPVE